MKTRLSLEAFPGTAPADRDAPPGSRVVRGAPGAETGTVTAGLFAGRTYAAALQSFPIQVPQACLTSGLSLINGGAVADITAYARGRAVNVG